MRSAVVDRLTRAARVGLALPLSLALAAVPVQARAQAPVMQPTSMPPPPSYGYPARRVLVDLRFSPPRALHDARLRVTPQQAGLPTPAEQPIYGPTLTLSLPPGPYAIEVVARRHQGRVDINVTPGMYPIEISLRRTHSDEAPKFQRDRKLVTGLGGSAMIFLLGGVSVLFVGGIRQGIVQRRNEKLLMDGLVDAASPTPMDPTGLALVEQTYPTAKYHHDLSRAMTLAAVGGGVAMAGLGAALATFPVGTQERLRQAYVELGFGAAFAAGGAAMLAVYQRDHAAILDTTDPTGRVTSSSLRAASNLRLGGALLAGLGAGLLVFPSVALLTDRIKRRRNRMGFAPYMAPGQAGLSLSGRF